MSTQGLLSVIMALVLAVPLSGFAGASEQSMLVEYYRYSLAPTGLVGVEGGCDSDAVGAVVFCQTLALAEPPDKFHVSIRDDVPVPTGGHWEFRSDDGVVLWEGSFCKQANDGPVPENATSFVVRVDLQTPQCGSVGHAGWVIVTWRWGRDPSPAQPPPPCCGCGCPS